MTESLFLETVIEIPNKLILAIKRPRFSLPVSVEQSGAASHANTCYLIGGIQRPSSPKK